MSLRLAFLGTPEIAVPVLEALSGAGFDIRAVITAPDRPRGRGMNVEPSAIKKRASDLGIEVFQPRTLRDQDVQRQLRELGADVFVVAAFGLILPVAVLQIPRHGCINVHFSLLPRLRGAAPVQWAIIEGLETTGVSIMQMDEGLDTGPVIASSEEPIHDEDTTGTLGARLARLGAALCVRTLSDLASGNTVSIPQDDAASSYAPKLGSADAHIDWSLSATSIRNRVRAFDPRPGAWSVLNGKRVKIWQVVLHPSSSVGSPGTIDVVDGVLLAQALDGLVEITQLQPEGRSRMSAAEFLRGYRPRTGDVLS